MLRGVNAAVVEQVLDAAAVDDVVDQLVGVARDRAWALVTEHGDPLPVVLDEDLDVALDVVAHPEAGDGDRGLTHRYLAASCRRSWISKCGEKTRAP